MPACLLATVFLTGFKEAISLATIVCIPYLLLNVVVLGRWLIEVFYHPEALRNWQNAVQRPRGLDRDCHRERRLSFRALRWDLADLRPAFR